MNSVEPIRNIDTLHAIYEYLKTENPRNYMLFMFGTNTARRISDILPLRVRDVRDKNVFYIREKKTGKLAEVAINRDLKQAIKAYCRGKRPYDYLFPSRKGGHIGRVQAYKIMRDVADVFKLDSIGTHTMRKTFGYHFIKNGGSIEVLMEILGHSDPAVTRRYIGITSEETRSAVKNFSFFK